MPTDLLQRKARENADAGVRQYRSVPFRDVQLRAKPDGTGGSVLQFTGYATVYERAYDMVDWWGFPYQEVMRAGAAKQTISQECDTSFLLNHGGHTLARTKPGTMTLTDDTTGVLTEADLDPRDPVVQSIQSAMERGDLDEMSMAFWITRQLWSPDYEQRDILEINLHKGDVSLVNYGANDATAGASLRGAQLRGHIQRLDVDERRDLYERLAAEFAAAPPAPVDELPDAVADNLDLYLARAQRLAHAQTARALAR